MSLTPGPVESLARLALQHGDYLDLFEAARDVAGNPVYDAAPDLLAVLPDLLDHYLNCYDGNKDALAHRAEAAIAKAKGEA